MTSAAKKIKHPETQRIRNNILSQLKDFCKKRDRENPPVIIRAEVDVKGLEALPWLAAQQPTSRGYWSDRDNHFELAGIGAADVITGDLAIDYHKLMKILHYRLATSNKSPRYFGGSRFTFKGRRENSWNYFKAYRFILPRFEVKTHYDRTTFACNMLSNEDINTIKAALSHLSFPRTDYIPEKIPQCLLRFDSPDYKQWCNFVKTTLDSLESDCFEKVVLSRKTTLKFSKPLNTASLLSSLKKNTFKCFHFLFQPHARSGFLGASPERLYSRDKDIIQTEAIAGSRRRGDSNKKDKALSNELATSEKDFREHKYVVDDIQKTLNGFCESTQMDENPRLLKLSQCQHLITNFKGKLFSGIKDADLLASFHPTPAVGGTPKDRALEEILLREPFDRGWYAGPVGWIGKDSAQFVVGIRSGLTEGRFLHLFAGAGIVKGSIPEEEWDEIEAKINDFVTLFDHP